MKVKSCPFCGGRPTLFEDNYDKYAIMCEKCNLYFGIELECGEELVDGWRAKIETFEEAVEKWNRRAEMLDLNKFKPFDFTEGVPYISITENGITFSKGVVSKLGRPPRVELLINESDKQFIIRSCNINKTCSNAFYKESSKTKYVRWNNKNLLMTIENIMGCDLSKYAYRVDGQYIGEEKAILFDLNNAVKVL